MYPWSAGIAYDQLLRCVHCGLCTSSCPTYLETGDENNGPRGRIQLIRLVADGRTDLTDRMQRHLELCLDCRACESACPSGVQYGRLIEPFRQAIEAKDTRVEKRWDLFRQRDPLEPFPLRRPLAPRAWPHAALAAVGHCLRDRAAGAAEDSCPGGWGGWPRCCRRRLDPARGCRNSCRPWDASGPAWRFSSVAWPMPCSAPCIGRRSACCNRTAATCSCRADKAAAARFICTTATPLGARRLADANLVAFELDRYDAILVNHGGCGAMLKEYGHHWHDGLQPHRARFAEKVKDVHEFLDNLGVVPFQRPHRGHGHLS